MTQYHCKCLNVTVHLVDKPEEIELEWLQEKTNIKRVGSGILGIGGVTTIFKELVFLQNASHNWKTWSIYSCMNCNEIIYAQQTHTARQVIVNMGLESIQEKLSHPDKIEGYSHTYQIIIETPHTDKENNSIISESEAEELLLRHTEEVQEKAFKEAKEVSDERIRLFILEEKQKLSTLRTKATVEQRSLWCNLRYFMKIKEKEEKEKEKEKKKEKEKEKEGKEKLKKGKEEPKGIQEKLQESDSLKESSPEPIKFNQLRLRSLIRTLSTDTLPITESTDLSAGAAQLHGMESPRNRKEEKKEKDKEEKIRETSPSSPKFKFVPGKLKKIQETPMFFFNELVDDIPSLTNEVEEEENMYLNNEEDDLDKELRAIQEQKWALRKAVEEGATPESPKDQKGKISDFTGYATSLPIAMGMRSHPLKALDTDDEDSAEEIEFEIPLHEYSKTLVEPSPFAEIFDRPTSVTRSLLRNI